MDNSDYRKERKTFAFSGGIFADYFRFLKGFLGLADFPTRFQDEIDQTLENTNPTWLDDINVVTKGSKQKHKLELIETLNKLEPEGYRLSCSKSERFKREIEWIGHSITQEGIRPLQDNLTAINELKVTENEKQLKSVLGDIQYLSKYIGNYSANTDILKQLVKKDVE